jgi:protein-L-isoaspartate(D-aspartate) O-methyltransferase
MATRGDRDHRGEAFLPLARSALVWFPEGMSTAVGTDDFLYWNETVSSTIEQAGIIDEVTEHRLHQALLALPYGAFLGFSGPDSPNLPFELSTGEQSARLTSIVRMLSLLRLRKGARVLEVGCGSGYTAALMSKMGAHVFTVGVQAPTAQAARRRLDAHGYERVIVHHASALTGWREHAPYDAILISLPIDEIESELYEQLQVPGGALVAPLRSEMGIQLMLWTTTEKGLQHVGLERPFLFP